jgi:hypothetical protein
VNNLVIPAVNFSGEKFTAGNEITPKLLDVHDQAG